MQDENLEARKIYTQKPYNDTLSPSRNLASLGIIHCMFPREITYVIVIHWGPRNYGSKRTDPEGATRGCNTRVRFVYVAIIPWQPVNH